MLPVNRWRFLYLTVLPPAQEAGPRSLRLKLLLTQGPLTASKHVPQVNTPDFGVLSTLPLP